MKSKTAIAAIVLVSVIITSCTPTGVKRTVAADSEKKSGRNQSTLVSSQSHKLKMQKGKCCSSNIPPRFPTKIK
ncbi:hypothetical protein BDE36_4082 [Arcticibacter tournemirensis]|nr:hypothetical protein BDE36_4082 [Arcticibacter tournemirensis]